MLDYAVRLYRIYPQKEIRQVVIYLTKSNSYLVRQNTYQNGQTSHQFELIRLWEIPCKLLLQSPSLVLEKDIIHRLLKEEIMKESVIYQEIKQEGRLEGKIEGEASLILRLLTRKFGRSSFRFSIRRRFSSMVGKLIVLLRSCTGSINP